MLTITDKAKFKLAAAQTIAEKVSLSGENTGARWFKAIEKAITEIKENPFIDFRDGELVILSRRSNRVHVLTAENCSEMCEAFSFEQVCYHRAIAEIWTRYYALLAPPAIPAPEAVKTLRYEMDAAPYFSGGFRKERCAERIGNVRI